MQFQGFGLFFIRPRCFFNLGSIGGMEGNGGNGRYWWVIVGRVANRGTVGIYGKWWEW